MHVETEVHACVCTSILANSIYTCFKKQRDRECTGTLFLQLGAKCSHQTKINRKTNLRQSLFGIACIVSKVMIVQMKGYRILFKEEVGHHKAL